MRQTVVPLDGFRLLSEYECGRAQIAIEWVARAQKPVVEIGGRPETECDLRALAHDLNRCIARSGETVRAFVIPDGTPRYCCYGFYRYPWAVEAMIFAWGKNARRPNSRQWAWIQGLIFGYSPDAIQRFISSASVSRGSMSHQPRHTEFHRVCLGRVEIYGPLALNVQRRNNQNGKRRTRC